ncbi:C40 family peptidase [Desulfovibrio desulfuricans]|uniref:C40 family peptidase n=1 Tax=Desulfovibrio desulfuricans TaxID=876 RepID=UPI0003B4DCB4|nr:C40 family peptidase [Desulfovibrio desulfuricans]MDD3683421.1 C40 family peptidase [Desulfovibrio desulfuricans]QTO41403.1 C40 family peptidase [Desulfovibrio desulfuricans]
MGRCLKLCALTLACAMTFGCAVKNNQRDDYSTQAEQRFRRSYEAAFDNNEQQGSQQLLRKARSAIGTPYVPGGMSPGGFDCSGFVCWAYKSVGVSLPRTAREQSVVGKRINNVEEMQVGDIVAFRHPRRGYHTGIYVGDGKFIHSPHRRTTVRVNSLDDPYFKGTFLGARRVKMDGTENLVAEAQTRLNDYAEEKAVRDIYRSHKPSSRSSVASNDDHRKSSKEKDKDRSRNKNPSKSRDQFVEVASLDKKHGSTRKIEVEKADKSSSRSSGKASVKEDKSDKKSSASSSKSSSSKAEAEKSERKSEARKSDAPKAETRKTENHKPEAAKSDSKSGSSKSSASKGEPTKRESAKSESGKKDKSNGKVASSKSDDGKSKKTPAKNRDKNS